MVAKALYPDEKFATTPKNMMCALDETLYSIDRHKWVRYPEPSDGDQQESAMAAYLNEFTRACWIFHTGKGRPLPEHVLRWTVTNSARTALNGEVVQALGIALVDARVTALQWTDVLCDIQIVSHVDRMPEAVRRLISGAANVFSSQEDRMYHTGIAFAGDTFQFVYFDRAGCIMSGILDTHADCIFLARVLMGLTILDSSYCGKDTSVVSRDGHRFVIVGGQEYQIAETLSISRDIRGRGTVCWRCRRPGSEMDFVIKNIWADVRQHPSEGDFLRKASNIHGISQLVCEEVIPWPGGELRTTFWLRDYLEGEMRYDIADRIPHLEQRRLVLEPYGRPLEEFASKDELLFAIRDAICAHQILYERENVLHCDISDNNIVLCEQAGASRRQGLLIDLDCAALVEMKKEYRLGPIGRKAGTLPFMACDILQHPRHAAHALWHDLESFLYVLMLTCASYAGPSNMPRKDLNVRTSLIGPWFIGDGDYKARIMYSYDDPAFRNFVDEVFHPYFDDLKGLVCELRTVIMREWNTRPTHTAVLDVFDRHIGALHSASKDVSAAPEAADGVDAVDEHQPHRGAKRKRRDAHEPLPAESSGGDARTIPSPARRRAGASSDSHTSDDSERTLVNSRQASEKTKGASDAPSFPMWEREPLTGRLVRSSKRRKVDHVDETGNSDR